jgi:hypothetical protein
MSEKSIENFQNNLAPQDREFLNKLGEASSVLDNPEDSQEKLELAKEQYRGLDSKSKKRLINEYGEMINTDKITEETKILIKEFLNWAETEDTLNGGQNPELN